MAGSMREDSGDGSAEGSRKRRGGRAPPGGAAKKKPPSLASAFEALQACPMGKVKPNPMRQSVVAAAPGKNSNGRPAAPEVKPPESKPAKLVEPAVEFKRVSIKKSPGGKKRSRAKSGRPVGRPKVSGIVQEKTPVAQELPDELRCKRSDGKDWRCKYPRMDGLGFCEKHASRSRKGAMEARRSAIEQSPPSKAASKKALKASFNKAASLAKVNKDIPIRETRTRSRVAAQIAQPAVTGQTVDGGLEFEKPTDRIEPAEELGFPEESTLGLPEESTLGLAEDSTLGLAEDSTLGLAEDSTLGLAEEFEDAAEVQMGKRMENEEPLKIAQPPEETDMLTASLIEDEKDGEEKIGLVESNGLDSIHVETNTRKLFWEPGSYNSWPVMITLEEKNLIYESIPIDLSNEKYKEEMAALNPRSEVPILVDKDLVICESGAICQYLDWTYSDNKPKLIPDDALLKMKVVQRMYETSNYSKLHNEMLGLFETEVDLLNSDLWMKKKAEFRKELYLWEGYLKDKSFLVGDSLTMADVFFYPLLATSVLCGLDLEKPGFPSLAGYHFIIGARESLAKTSSLLQKETQWQQALADL